MTLNVNRALDISHAYVALRKPALRQAHTELVEGLRACPVPDTGANGKGENPFVLSGLYEALACPELDEGSKHESACRPIYEIASSALPPINPGDAAPSSPGT